MYAISRFQCGVTINPKEYVRDENNEVMEFETKDKAIVFLAPHYDTDNLEDQGIYIDEYKKTGGSDA